MVPARKVAAAVPLVFPNVNVPVPKAPPDDVSSTVPASMVKPPVKVLFPVKFNCELALFCTRPVTLVPITALISTEPEPEPALVMVPVLFTDVPDTVIPLAIVLLLSSVKLPLPVTPPVMLKLEVLLVSMILVTWGPIAALISTEPEPDPALVIVPVLVSAVDDKVIPLAVVPLLSKVKLPVPVTPPETVKAAVLLLVSVVPEPLTITPPLMVKAVVELFSVTLVTFAPIPPLIVVVPLPAPRLVTAPVLLMLPVANVTVPLVAFSLIVKLLVPVTPPLKVVDIAVPLLPMVRVSPLASVFKTIALV